MYVENAFFIVFLRSINKPCSLSTQYQQSSPFTQHTILTSNVFSQVINFQIIESNFNTLIYLLSI